MVDTPQKRQWYKIRNAAPADDGVPEVLIYDEIDSWFGVAAADLVRELAEIDAPDILVRINSPGGDMFDGIAIMNGLRGHNARIVVQVDGLAASAASVIAMGGDEIVMNDGSQMMLHNAWAVCVGSAEKMQKTSETLARQNSVIANIYAGRAGGSADEWLAVMAEETWLTAQETVDAGLANRVVQPPASAAAEAQRVAASFDRSRFRYSGREAAPAPKIAARVQTPQPQVEAEVTEGKEPTVASLNESALEALGLDAEADDEAVSAAIAELSAKATAEPPEPPAATEPSADQLPAVAAKFGLRVVDNAAWDRLSADAAAGAQAKAQQIAEADEHTITNALRQGQITSANADTWRAALKENGGGNRDQVKALLGTLPVNAAVPVAEMGHAYTDPNGTAVMDHELENMFNRVTGLTAATKEA